MSATPRHWLKRASLSTCVVALAACTTVGVVPPSRPAPSPVPTPPPRETTPAPRPTPPPSAPAPAPPREGSAPSVGGAAAPRPRSDASSASDALVAQSRAQRAAGSVPAAKASLERALRLDPNNAEVWIELGELELSVGNRPQAATLARKALTLTGRDVRLAARAERLLRAAE
jgi:tetratricopeptide (TPR) repeat protein